MVLTNEGEQLRRKSLAARNVCAVTMFAAIISMRGKCCGGAGLPIGGQLSSVGCLSQGGWGMGVVQAGGTQVRHSLGRAQYSTGWGGHSTVQAPGTLLRNTLSALLHHKMHSSTCFFPRVPS